VTAKVLTFRDTRNIAARMDRIARALEQKPLIARTVFTRADILRLALWTLEEHLQIPHDIEPDDSASSR